MPLHRNAVWFSSGIDVHLHRNTVLLAALLGLRRSEIAGLQWHDVDFDAGVLNLHRGVVNQQISALKTAGSKRALPVPDAVLNALAEWRAETQFNKPEDWLFASSDAEGKQPLWFNSLLERVILPVGATAGNHEAYRLAHVPQIVRHTLVFEWGEHEGDAGANAAFLAIGHDGNLRSGSDRKETGSAEQDRRTSRPEREKRSDGDFRLISLNVPIIPRVGCVLILAAPKSL